MKGHILLVVGILTTNDTSAFTSVVSSPTKRIAIVNSNSIALQRRLDNKSSSRSSTSLSAMSLPSLSAATATISGFYKTFPLLAGFLTCSTKASIADSMAQHSSREEGSKFSFKRNLAMVLYSGVVLGMLCEIMYNNIFPISEYLYQSVHIIVVCIIAFKAQNAHITCSATLNSVFGTANTLFRAVKCTLFDGFINAPFLWLPPAVSILLSLFHLLHGYTSYACLICSHLVHFTFHHHSILPRQ